MFFPDSSPTDTPTDTSIWNSAGLGPSVSAAPAQQQYHDFLRMAKQKEEASLPKQSDPFGYTTSPTSEEFGFNQSVQHPTDAFGYSSKPDNTFRFGAKPFEPADSYRIGSKISTPGLNFAGKVPKLSSPVIFGGPLRADGAETPTDQLFTPSTDGMTGAQVREAQIFNPSSRIGNPLPGPRPTEPIGTPRSQSRDPLGDRPTPVGVGSGDPTPHSSPSSVPSPVPTNKDPGYFSESECSSNSSENFIAALKSLQLKEEAAALPHYDAQSFETPTPEEEKAEDWRCIKKPGMQPLKEGDIWGSSGGLHRMAGGMVGDGASPWSAPKQQPSQICKFCRNNREDESVYTTHTLMSPEGKIVCPILYAYECKVCKATGDYAHTLKYCPMLRTAIGPGKVKTPALPLQATFPQHLSANAKSMMAGGNGGGHSGGHSVGSNGGHYSGNTGNRPPMDKLADLRNAAQKIISFTDQMMGAQQPASAFPALPDYLAEFQQKQLQPIQRFQPPTQPPLPPVFQQMLQQLQSSANTIQAAPFQAPPFSAPQPQFAAPQVSSFQPTPQFEDPPYGAVDPSTELLKLLGIHKSEEEEDKDEDDGDDVLASLRELEHFKNAG